MPEGQQVTAQEALEAAIYLLGEQHVFAEVERRRALVHGKSETLKDGLNDGNT